MMQKTEFSKKNTLALKGVAIIMMMFHHCFWGEQLFKDYNVSFFPFNQDFIVNLSLTFKICVSIFAFLTGYGLLISLKKLNEKYEWSKKEIGKWTVGRLIKTLSGYWIIVVLALIICQIINGRTQEVFFYNGVIYGIIQMSVNFLGLSDLLGITGFCSSWWYISIAILFVISVPIFVKCFKKYGYLKVIITVILIPRIIGWEYVNSSYIAFLLAFLLGIIFAENNLMVKIANIKMNKNQHINKAIKFVAETLIIVLLYKVYNQLPVDKFWETRYGIIPVCLICYLYEFFIDLPILRNILEFLGKHSMNIFLIHEFIRTYYLNVWIYSFSNFLEIVVVLLGISLGISMLLELFKKLIKYDKWIGNLQNFIDKKIDNINDGLVYKMDMNEGQNIIRRKKMKVEKIKEYLYKTMLFILLVMVVYVTYCSIFNIYKQAEDLKPIVIILGTVVCIFVFIGVKKIVKKIKESRSNLVAICICIVFFVGMTVIGSKVTSIPTYDLSDLQKEAQIMLQNGGTFVNSYFERYTNQAPVTILIYFIYKIATFLKFSNLRVFGATINALFIAITAFFTYLSVKRLKNYKIALTTLIFFAINPIFYTYTSYFYTDTLCMPFAMSAIYLFIVGLQSKNKRITLISLLSSGLLLAFGFEIRVVVGILLIGMIISIILNHKFNKKMLRNIGSLILGFIIGILLYKLIAIPFNIPENKDEEYPLAHWPMMALNEESDGQWNSEDLNYTYGAGNYSEKLNAEIKMIKSRLESLGLTGWLSLAKTKLAVNWSNGDYTYLSYLANVEEVNNIYEYIAGNKRIFILYYCQICKATMLLMFMISIIKQFGDNERNKTYNAIYISVFGAFIFYLIWEVKSRYSLSFLPWMILTFGIGIEQIENIFNIKEIKCKFKNNKVKDFDFEILKKGIIVSTILCSAFLLLINYKQYAVKKKTYFDNRVIQSAEMKNYIKTISNNTIEQTFKVNRKFNSIQIKFKTSSSSSTTHYNFALLDSSRTVLYEEEFISDDILENVYKRFYFDDIKPNGEQEYIIQIYSSDATYENSIGIASFYMEDYSVYPNGILTLNGKVEEASMVFKVQNKTERTYTTRRIYITMSMIIIVLEIFAFYPYLRKDDKKLLSKKCGKTNSIGDERSEKL